MNIRKNKMLLLIGFGLVAIAITLGVIAYTETTQVKSWLKVDKNYDCYNQMYNEIQPVYANVTYTKDIATVCQNYSIENQTFYNYICKNGTESYTRQVVSTYVIVQKQRSVCDEISYKVNYTSQTEEIIYHAFGKCSYVETTDGIKISCDSKHDGNGDGICQSGESCCAYTVTNSGVQSNCKLDTGFVQGLKPLEVLQ